MENPLIEAIRQARRYQQAEYEPQAASVCEDEQLLQYMMEQTEYEANLERRMAQN